MKVGVVASDVAPCELYRAGGPAKALAAAGEIQYERLEQGLKVRQSSREHGPDSPVGLTEFPNVDVVVLTRGVLPARIVEVIPLLQREGIAVVIDFDDDYEHLPPLLARRYKLNPRTNPFYNWANAKRAARIADLVTVSTPALQRYRDDAVLLRNCIPARYMTIRPRGDGQTIGWSGTVYGHPGDLRVTHAGVVEALRSTGGRFVNVGDGMNIRKDLCLDCEPVITGFVSLDEYPQRLAMLDVGIAPLVSSAYANAKSSLKPLEYLALGAQYVASPTPEYVRLTEELEQWCAVNDRPVPGAIAKDRSRDWKRGLERALRSRQVKRHDLTASARDFVIERYCMEERAGQWGEAWEMAYKRRRQANGRARASR